MSALQRILDRMPSDEHRHSFQRLITEAGVREDSPDMVFLALDHEARWSAVQAMGEERDRIKELLDDLPIAMRDAGAEIVRGLADDIAIEVSKKIAADAHETVGAALSNHAENTEFLLNKQHEQVTQFVDVARDAVQKAGAGAQHALKIASELRSIMRRFVAGFVIVPLIALLAGAGVGAFLEGRAVHGRCVSKFAHAALSGTHAQRQALQAQFIREYC
ncbi:MAG TPA: hypothetical protein VFO29_11865 [Candidatus Rubrimentiphilum sp.]|nr:hypothetical protein [Candidatus Rubrimentiphilum sp.]